MSTWYARVGDGAVPVSATLRDASGAVNLTGSTVTFQARQSSSTIAGTATLTDATNGVVTYTLTSANLATAPTGTWQVTWQVAFSGSHIETFPRPGTDTLIIDAQLD